MKESDIQRAILEWLEWNGWIAIKINNQNMISIKGRLVPCKVRPGQVGVSDILAFKNGLFAAIEVKVPGNYPTQNQKDFLAKVEQNGGIAFVARSVDDVEAKLSPESHQDKLRAESLKNGYKINYAKK